MDEDKKDLAKRFFTLLYLFLTRKYQEVDLVFIRHTDDAEEVDEDRFFHDTRSGGTVVLSALELAEKIRRERYATDWNVYAAQASDGDAFGADPARSARFLREHLLPFTRYYTYLELTAPSAHERSSTLWAEYERLTESTRNFAMRRASEREQIYPVFAICSRRKPNEARAMSAISRGADWDFDLLERYDREISRIAGGLRSRHVPNQIEVITSEQMLDAYASSGLPVGYPAWSYGKEFIRNEQAYRRGMQGLAYEIVINSSPCIAYLMEENTMSTQALVIAHASYGHNSFFKGNHLFRQWTSADAILDYLVFARRFVMQCEERHGADGGRGSARCVPRADAARRRSLSASRRADAQGRGRAARRARGAPRAAVQRSLADAAGSPGGGQAGGEQRVPGRPPGEHSLFRREVFAEARAVGARARSHRAQARAVLLSAGPDQGHERRLGDVLALHDSQQAHEERLVDDGFMLEFLKNHTNVVTQPGFDSPAYNGLNPYALGFAMFADLKRICEKPMPRIASGSPDIAGGDWQKVLDFRDAQLQGRVVRRAVSVAAAHARVPPVRARRSHGRRHAARRQHSRRARLPPSAASSSRSSTHRRCACPMCRSSASIATAIAR
jgi:stage V sporulation protein R